MPRENERMKGLLHQQLGLVVKSLHIRAFSFAERQSDQKLKLFIEEIETAFTTAISTGEPVVITGKLELSKAKYEIVKSYIIIWQTRIIVRNSIDQELALTLKADFIAHFHKVLNSSYS